jgi:hypothetical protein
MAKLVQRSAIPVDRFVKGSLRRHLHKIMAGTVKGLAAADLKACAARLDQRIGVGDSQQRIGADHGGGEVFGQSLALIDVEHDKALQEGNLPRLAILAARRLGFGLGGEAVGVADDGALLAAPDIAPRRLGLPVGEPALRGISLGNPLGPQEQHIDPRIAPSGSRVLRYRASARRTIPRLHPR